MAKRKGDSRDQGRHGRLVLVAFSLGLVWSVIIFSAVRHHAFIDFDDPAYVTDNPNVSRGLSWDGIKWAAVTTHASNWHPVTWMSHMLDISLFGPDAGWHHLMSVFFHIANAALLFWIGVRLFPQFPWRAAAIAGLFVIHPLDAESVAWISERKNVLSTGFGFLTLHAYLRYVQNSAPERMALTTILFGFSLMSKPMLVTLPILLLLLDVWPLGRLSSQSTSAERAAWRLLVEKTPLWVLVAASSIMTLYAQRARAVAQLDLLPVSIRVSNALVSYAGYLKNIFWPADLAFFYPHPGFGLPVWLIIFSALLFLFCTAGSLLSIRRFPYLAFGWFWFVFALIPVIGLVQVGRQAMADRYTYIPQIGIHLAIVFAACDMTARYRRHQTGILVGTALVVWCALSMATWRQVRTWSTSRTLYEHAVRVTRGNYLAHYNLGSIHFAEGRWREALEQYEAVHRIKPEGYPGSFLNAGIALEKLGRADDAVALYRESLRIHAHHIDILNNLGNVLARQGKLDAAIETFDEILQINPDHSKACNNLGNAYLQKGAYENAIEHYRRAILLNPGLHLAYTNLGQALIQLDRLDEAKSVLERALALGPSAEANYYLGNLHARRQDMEKAIQFFSEAVQINPGWTAARENLERARGQRPHRTNPMETRP